MSGDFSVGGVSAIAGAPFSGFYQGRIWCGCVAIGENKVDIQEKKSSNCWNCPFTVIFWLNLCQLLHEFLYFWWWWWRVRVTFSDMLLLKGLIYTFWWFRKIWVLQQKGLETNSQTCQLVSISDAGIRPVVSHDCCTSLFHFLSKLSLKALMVLFFISQFVCFDVLNCRCCGCDAIN